MSIIIGGPNSVAIEKVEDGEYDVECDECACVSTFNAGDWSELMAEMYTEGWGKRRADGGWCHFCPECSEEMDDDEEDDG